LVPRVPKEGAGVPRPTKARAIPGGGAFGIAFFLKGEWSPSTVKGIPGRAHGGAIYGLAGFSPVDPPLSTGTVQPRDGQGGLRMKRWWLRPEVP